MNNLSERAIEVDAILFDMDGTLIDSSGACARIWTRWAQHYGLEPQSVIDQSHGRRPEDTARSILGDDADIKAAVDLFTAEEAKESHVTTILGAKELITTIPEGKWAIVTSSTEGIAKTRLAYCGITEPKALVTAEKVRAGKPDPEGYLQAAEKLGVDIRRCLVVEDAPGGIEAGHRSGAFVIAVATTYNPSKFPSEVVVSDLRDIIVTNVGEEGKMQLTVKPVNNR
ncbi:HAD-IA family hydrolase [Xenorhabdus sp. IM139775]|uniref:HAD-IA family hydrolase n=1 Tax=Xenorhabdus sp. IM139775 TaxID=3025876 RepID=UPI0023593F40|nr:HAD-IA family hydrolase [Xenorhabdus sp. IM139775]MDC9595059.1 HAD-IA family hydrolase [Xenorhabdus sp. IM139775]